MEERVQLLHSLKAIEGSHKFEGGALVPMLGGRLVYMEVTVLPLGAGGRKRGGGALNEEGERLSTDRGERKIGPGAGETFFFLQLLSARRVKTLGGGRGRRRRGRGRR